MTDCTVHFVDIPVSLLYNRYSGYSCLLVSIFSSHIQFDLSCLKIYQDLVITSGGSRIFPRGGREPSRGGVNTPNFPENCMKSKEFGRPGGGVRPSRPPLDPPIITEGYEILQRKNLVCFVYILPRLFYCEHVSVPL